MEATAPGVGAVRTRPLGGRECGLGGSWRTDRHGRLGVLVRFSGNGQYGGSAAVVYPSSEVGGAARPEIGEMRGALLT